MSITYNEQTTLFLFYNDSHSESLSFTVENGVIKRVSPDAAYEAAKCGMISHQFQTLLGSDNIPFTPESLQQAIWDYAIDNATHFDALPIEFALSYGPDDSDNEIVFEADWLESFYPQGLRDMLNLVGTDDAHLEIDATNSLNEIVKLGFAAFPNEATYLYAEYNGYHAILSVYDIVKEPEQSLKRFAQAISTSADSENDEIVFDLPSMDGYRLHLDKGGEFIRFSLNDNETAYWHIDEFVDGDDEEDKLVSASQVLGALTGAMISVDMP